MSVMEITTVVHCSLMCTFCPQIPLKKAYGNNEKIMSLESFSKFLSKIPEHVDIHFSGYAEAWLNPNATEMLKMSLTNNHRVAIYTTMYGMSIDDAKNVIDLCTNYREQIKILVLHLPDINKNMRGFKMTQTYKDVLSLFVKFKKENILKEFNIMTMDSSNKFDTELVDIILDNKITDFGPISRAGSLEESEHISIGSVKHSTQIYCSATPYYDKNVLMPNGDVALCCMDYNLKHIIGNLNDQEYSELIDSEELRKIKSENSLNRYSDKTICRNCECARPLDDFIPLNYTKGKKILNILN